MRKLILLLGVVFAFVGCNSSNNPMPNPNLDGLVLDAKLMVDGSDLYKSFEFNDHGTYIVEYVQSAGRSMIMGTYDSDGDDAVIMKNFGRLEIVSNDSNGVLFDLTRNGAQKAETFSATKANTIESSSKTDMLCRTWKFKSFKDGEGNDLTQGDSGVLLPNYVFFSKAKSYVVSYYDGTATGAEWEWKDEAEGEFYYAFYGVWDKSDFVKITTLTDERLVIADYRGYEESGFVAYTTLEAY